MINFDTFQDFKSLFQSVWKFWPPPDDLYCMRNGKVPSPYCLWHQGQCFKGLHPPWKFKPYLNDLSSMQNEKPSDPYYLFYWDQSSVWLHFPLKSSPHLYNHENKPDGNMLNHQYLEHWKITKFSVWKSMNIHRILQFGSKYVILYRLWRCKEDVFKKIEFTSLFYSHSQKPFTKFDLEHVFSTFAVCLAFKPEPEPKLKVCICLCYSLKMSVLVCVIQIFPEMSVLL